MENTKFKASVKKGFFWSAIERFGVQTMQIIINIILARLLLPSDFALIGMLTVFIGLSQSFVNSGLGSGLIQKKDRDQTDFSTVFYFNLGTSLIIYLILFLSAPLISQFYGIPELIDLTRVLCLIIVINALGLIQTTRMKIDLDFKKIAQINIVAIILSGSISIYFALEGLGVWSLVLQTLLYNSLIVCISWIVNKWLPTLEFSISSFKSLYNFGYKLLFAGLLATLNNDMYKLIMGKVYPINDLGYYTQSKQYTDSSSGTLTSIIQSVSFPVLASLQNKNSYNSTFLQILGLSAFVTIPIMVLLIILAEPIIILLLTEKWRPAIPYLQILCLSRIFFPVSALNMNSFSSIGRSDIYLKADLIKTGFTLLLIPIFIQFGPLWFVSMAVVKAILALLLESYFVKSLFNISFSTYYNKMFKIVLITIFTALIIIFLLQYIPNYYVQIFTGISVGSIIYLVLCYIFKIKEINTLKEYLKL